MPKAYSDPTFDKILESQLDEKGPSVCKKNKNRDPARPMECTCKEGLCWPYCRWWSRQIKNFGFQIADD